MKYLFGFLFISISWVAQKALKKYLSLEDLISSYYGEANTIDGHLSNLQLTKERNDPTKKNVWLPNDSTKIEMHTAISNFYGNVFDQGYKVLGIQPIVLMETSSDQKYRTTQNKIVP